MIIFLEACLLLSQNVVIRVRRNRALTLILDSKKVVNKTPESVAPDSLFKLGTRMNLLTYPARKHELENISPLVGENMDVV